MLPRICCIYFSNPFFISPRSTITSGIVVAFIPHILSISISRSLYFDSFSFTLTELLILFRGDGHINKQAAFFLFVLDYKVWSVSVFLTICLYLQIRSQDCDVVFFCYCLGLIILVPFLHCVYIHLFADVPV